MVTQRKSGKSHFEPHDRYFAEAKQRGFKSRAAFKLIEIDQKYHLFKQGQTVLDLGAAPGGWSQVALQAVGKSGRVVGVDLDAIKGLSAPNLSFIKGDLRTAETQEAVHQLVGPADVVLSDMAPATTGIKFKDQMASAELVREALALTLQVLKAGGSFVAKIFPSEELAEIKKEFKTDFEIVKEMTPAASRGTSNEVYLIALEYKGTTSEPTMGDH